MFWLYNTVLLAVLVALAPLWLVMVVASPRLRRGFSERLRPLPASAPGTVWLHAASVGEVEAAVPLLEALADRDIPLLATTLTRSGRERLRERLPGLRARLAPLDLPGLVHGSLRRARVSLLVLVETEIWPNTIWAAQRQGRPVVIVSGRISDSSFPTYHRLRFLFGNVLRCASRILARSAEDRERFRALGVPEERASLGGDLKLDRPEPPKPSAALMEALGAGPFLVGGSTHPGEEEALLEAWLLLRARSPALRLILAPRHPERAAEIADAMERRGVRPGLRSEGTARAEVVILDTLGELASIYRIADLVFAGGTLAPVGGHNLIEPVQAGRIVVHGPHTQNQRSQEQLLAPLGVLRRVESEAELGAALAELWCDPERNTPAARARPELEKHRGAVALALALVLELQARHA